MRTPTKLDEVVWSLGAMDVMPMLVTELLVDVLQVAEGQLGRVCGLTQGQVADPLLDDVAVGTSTSLCSSPYIAYLSTCNTTRRAPDIRPMASSLILCYFLLISFTAVN